MLPLYRRAAGMGVLRAAWGAWGDTGVNMDLISLVSGSLDSSGSRDCVGSVSILSPRCEKNDGREKIICKLWGFGKVGRVIVIC